MVDSGTNATEISAAVTHPAESPTAIYRERQSAALAEAARHEATFDRWGWVRLGAFVLIVLAMLGLGPAEGKAWLALIPAAMLVLAVTVSARVSTKEQRARRIAAWYGEGLVRVEDAWHGVGPDGAAWRPKGHLYDRDLDVTGPASLFERIGRVRLVAGARALAAWMHGPATVSEIRARQAAVAELATRMDLREDLAVLGADVRHVAEGDRTRAWASADPRLRNEPLRWILLAVSAVSGVLLVAWLAEWPGTLRWLILVWTLAHLLWRLRAKPATEVLREVERPAQELGLARRSLDRLREETFEAPYLIELQGRLASEDDPTKAVRRLERLAGWIASLRNPYFLPIAWMLSLGTQMAYAVEAWRARHGASALRWLEALGELDALAAIAAYAYERPQDAHAEVVSPEVAPDEPGAAAAAGKPGVVPIFEAVGLGHPLLPDASCIRNDVTLGGRSGPHVLIVSGSNMSGKSTLLRAIGINLLLTRLGAPVRATSLRCSPMHLGASLRVEDELSEGLSRFYAEARRVGSIVAGAKAKQPYLFLLDEILAGTNSADRRAGAQAIVQALRRAGAIGLVTTHDLALTAMADGTEGQITNVHFRDELIEGALSFDYRMRPGVVPHSNALALLRTVGIEVGEDDVAGVLNVDEADEAPAS